MLDCTGRLAVFFIDRPPRTHSHFCQRSLSRVSNKSTNPGIACRENDGDTAGFSCRGIGPWHSNSCNNPLFQACVLVNFEHLRAVSFFGSHGSWDVRCRSSLTLLFNELRSSNASSAAHSIAFLSRFQCRSTSSSSPNKWWVTSGSAVAWQLVIDSHHTAISPKHLKDNGGHQIHQTNRYNHDDGQKVKTFNGPFCICQKTWHVSALSIVHPFFCQQAWHMMRFARARTLHSK